MKKSSNLPEAVGTKGDNVLFRAYVDVDAAMAVKNDALLISYEIVPTDVTKIMTPNLSSEQSMQIYQIPSIRSEKLKRDKELIVYSGTADITKYLPNNKIKELKSGAPVKKFTTVRQSNSLKSIKPPTSQSSVVNEVIPTAEVAKKTYKTFAGYKKKDPAHELNSISSHAPISKSLSGFRTTGNYQNFDLHFEATRLSMQKVGNTISSIERADLDVKFVTVPIDIEIPSSNVSSYSLVIRAIKNRDEVQRFDQIIDFSSVLKDAIIPSIAPKISAIDNGVKRKLGIKQLDPRAALLKVYRKSLNKDSAAEDSYELISTLNAASGDSFNISDLSPSFQQGIYRAVSYDSSGMTIGEFASVTIGKSRISNQRNVEDPITIFAYESSEGIQISIYNIPYGVVATRLIRRNLSIHEKKFSTPESIGKNAQISIEPETTTISFLDKPLRPDAVFEYKVVMTDSRGNSYESQRSCIVYFVGSKSIEESKSLISQDHRVESDGSNLAVSFQIDVSASKTTLEQVYDVLASTGLDAQYLDEIKSNRELLNKIVALEITRFDSVTGYVENFGVVKTGTFEDSPRTRKVYGVSEVLPGRKYVYHARLLVRSPSTIFNQSNLSRTDVETNKTFTTNLKKYNSPKTLRKGTLSSNVVQKRSVSITGLAADPSSSTDDEMIAGLTSTTISITVDVPQKDSSISDIFLRKTHRGNEISWSLSRNDRKIDHVIVHADYNGRMAPLRAIHFDGNSKMIFLDNVLSNEPTPVDYYVQVVYANYDMGSIIGPARSR